MTAKEHAAQRNLVTASLASTHHPDTYISRRGRHSCADDNPCGGRARERDVVEAAASHAPEGTNAGQDGRPREPAPRVGRECSKCKGTGEIRYNPTPWGLPVDPQLEALYECLNCSGTGTVPVPRVVPGTRRAA